MSSDKLLKNMLSEKEQKSTPANQQFTKVNLMEIKGEGVFRFRIISNLIDPDELPFEQVFIHLGFVHPNFGKRVPLPCLGKNCPLCNHFKRKEQQGDGEAWRYKCNQRYIYYVLNDDNELTLLSLTYAVQSELQSEMISYLKNKINIMDLNAGRWVQITARNINNRWKYTANIEDESHSIPQETRNQFKNLRPLKTYYRPYGEEDLKKILRGEKIQFASPKPNPNRPQAEPAEGEEKKYKPMKTVVEKKIQKPASPVYSSETVDSFDDDRMLDNIIDDDGDR